MTAAERNALVIRLADNQAVGATLTKDLEGKVNALTERLARAETALAERKDTRSLNEVLWRAVGVVETAVKGILASRYVFLLIVAYAISVGGEPFVSYLERRLSDASTDLAPPK